MRPMNQTFGPGVQTMSVSTMGFHLELDELGGIVARVARRAKLAFPVLYGFAQRFERKISERIRFQVSLNLIDGLPRRN